MDSGPPSTPPRMPRAANPYTPKSAFSHRKPGHRAPAGFRSPFDTPKRKPAIAAAPAATHDRDHAGDAPAAGDSPSSLPGLAVFLPTPSTAGRDRKSTVAFSPPASSKRLTAALLDAAGDASSAAARAAPATPRISQETFSGPQETLSSPQEPLHKLKAFPATPQPAKFEVPQTPTAAPFTPPPPHSIEQNATFDAFSDGEESVQVVDVDELRHIKRYNMPNPFLSQPESAMHRKPSAKFATHMETINHTTGERRLEKLTPEQMRFKPRKLDFSQAESPKVNYSLTNKLLAHSMGKTFTMGDYPCESSKGFDIFEDE